MATNGITWRDSASNKLVLEYSDEVPPIAGATWNAVDEVRGITINPEASAESSFTSYESTTEEFKLGLPRPGGSDIVCIFDPESASQAAVAALDASKSQRWWRITHPKADTTNGVASSFMTAAFVSTASNAYPDSDTSDPVLFNFSLRHTGTSTRVAEAAS